MYATHSSPPASNNISGRRAKRIDGPCARHEYQYSSFGATPWRMSGSRRGWEGRVSRWRGWSACAGDGPQKSTYFSDLRVRKECNTIIVVCAFQRQRQAAARWARGRRIRGAINDCNDSPKPLLQPLIPSTHFMFFPTKFVDVIFTTIRRRLPGSGTKAHPYTAGGGRCVGEGGLLAASGVGSHGLRVLGLGSDVGHGWQLKLRMRG